MFDKCKQMFGDFSCARSFVRSCGFLKILGTVNKKARAVG